MPDAKCALLLSLRDMDGCYENKHEHGHANLPLKQYEIQIIVIFCQEVPQNSMRITASNLVSR